MHEQPRRALHHQEPHAPGSHAPGPHAPAAEPFLSQCIIASTLAVSHRHLQYLIDTCSISPILAVSHRHSQYHTDTRSISSTLAVSHRHSQYLVDICSVPCVPFTLAVSRGHSHYLICMLVVTIFAVLPLHGWYNRHVWQGFFEQLQEYELTTCKRKVVLVGTRQDHWAVGMRTRRGSHWHATRNRQVAWAFCAAKYQHAS